MFSNIVQITTPENVQNTLCSNLLTLYGLSLIKDLDANFRICKDTCQKAVYPKTVINQIGKRSDKNSNDTGAIAAEESIDKS